LTHRTSRAKLAAPDRGSRIVTTLPPALPATRRAERLFYLAMAVAIAAAVFLGFARTFFLRAWFPEYAQHHAPTEVWFYVHGAFFATWIAVFVAQAALVSAGNVALHRKLGTVGFVLIPAMVLLGIVGALIAARRPTGFIDVALPPLVFLAKPILDMVWFAVLATLALANRRVPPAHKRLMLLATIALLEAAIVRWPVGLMNVIPDLPFVLKCLFIVPLVAWDYRSMGRLHPVTLWGGLFVITEEPVFALISSSAPWLEFARWATGLLG
jgi:hypothetical protein